MAERPRRKTRGELHGILVLDKPRGMTSHDVVEEMGSRIGVATAGHTGTLDPLATGVLPVCLGAATKLAGWLLADDKAYEADLELGVETDSLDVDGVELRRDPEAAARVDARAIEAALAGLRGEHDQMPPMFSAIKRAGVPLHELARAGVEVDRTARRVRIDRLELLEFAPPRVRIAVACSKGTYVRAIVRDIGAALGCGATLAGLRRTGSGRFTLADAITLTGLTRERAIAHLIPPAHATGLPAVTVPESLWNDVLDGRPIDPALARDAGVGEGTFQMLTPAGDVLAIAELAAGPDGAPRIRFHRVLGYGTGGRRN